MINCRQKIEHIRIGNKGKVHNIPDQQPLEEEFVLQPRNGYELDLRVSWLPEQPRTLYHLQPAKIKHDGKYLNIMI